MTAVANLLGQTNGLAPLSKELTEYEKILKIRDDIFAGIHPRLKLPEHVRRISSLQKQPPVSTQPFQSTTVSAPVPDLNLPGLDLGKLADEISTATPPSLPPQLPAPVNGLPTPFATSISNKPSASGLDPIFLTKSDDLIRAEIQLQRQRLEKQLREQAEHKRNEARTKTATAEAKPDFDVTEVLESALELVKPITLGEIQEANATAIASTSDSVDDNSFYSSRAPDSTPEDGEDRSRHNGGRRMQPQTIDLDDEADAHMRNPFDDNQQSARAVHKAHVLGRRDSRTVPSLYQQAQDPSDRYSPPDAQLAPYDDADDEPEYSPPEPAEPLLAYPASVSQKPSQRRRSNGRAYDQHRRSPSADPRIVRNTITSPLAPQPARLSFLAQTKEFPLLQSRRQYGGMESERTSPETQTLPRKRRKVQEGKKGKHSQRKGARSPGTMIKEEPVSPPPFHDVPPLLKASASGSERHMPIDVDSPREVRYVPVERAHEYDPRPVAYTMESPAGQVQTARSFSRPVYREIGREDQDLRRVASIQNMQANHQPEYVSRNPYQDERMARAPSYAVLDRPPARAASVMYEAPRVTSARQYVSDKPTPTSPMYREEYVMERPASGATVMAAPPPVPLQPERRIVVDQAGNRYYETITAPREIPSSMAPPQRQMIRDPYEAAPTRYTRASTVFEAPQRETRYVQEMPPPQFSSRVSVAPRSETYDQHNFGSMQPITGQRDGNMQVMGYQPRQTSVYVDERSVPHEGYVRMSSVRPAETYGPGRFQGVSSVRPMERATSVFAEERGPVPREYLPVQQSPYAVTQPSPQQHSVYFQGSDGNQMSVDDSRNVRYSVVPQQRY